MRNPQECKPIMEENLFCTTADAREFRKKLRAWYARHKRELPWRATCDPYRIWLSEIMLQQTTVATVMPYFERFLNRFPDVTSLANANESEVLRLWEGLGYYSRARNIFKTASIISQQYNGEFPQNLDELQLLPGIGRYTAGAIFSFAYNRPAPIVEANTQRLYARVAGYAGELTNSAGQKILWAVAEELLPKRQPGSFNQALMELGSQVCTPVDPACQHCPVSDYCIANQKGKQHKIPRPKKKPIITEVTHLCVAVEKRKRFLLHQYQESERWAGLWDFPRWEIESSDAELFEQQLAMLSQTDLKENSLFEQRELHDEIFSWIENDVWQRYKFQINLTAPIATIKHAVTRYKIRLICMRAKHLSGQVGAGLHNCKWVGPSQFDQYPLSTTARKMAATIQQTKKP